MRKLLTIAVAGLASEMILLGLAQAQQSPPATTPQAPPASSTQTPAAKTAPKPPAAKTGTTTARTAVPLTLKTQKDKASYAIGLNMGKGMLKDSVDIDPNIFVRGMKDGLAGGKTLMTDDEARAAIGILQAELRKKQEEKMKVQQEQLKVLGDANKKEGEAFFAENKAKDGVVTLPSGLQYKILQEGTGPKPTATDTVVCNYKGTLLDNTEFDSSYKHGQPATFQVGRVIKGWSEALQLMPVGSKWQLFIPSELAYGEAGRPGIAPNATLVFEVELMSIQPKAEVQPANPPATPKPNQ